MNKEQYEVFLKAARAERSGLVLDIKPSDLNIVVREVDVQQNGSLQRVLFLQNGKELPLSQRAKGNVLRLTGFSNRLFNELEPQDLQTGLNTQLARFSQLAMSEYEDEVITIFNGRKPYLPYETILPDAEDLVFIKGDPIRSDAIEFQTNEGVVNIGEEEVVLGLNGRVSSTCQTSARLTCGTFREICTNGAYFPWYFHYRFERMDVSLFRAATREFRENVDNFSNEIRSFVESMQSYNLVGIEDISRVVETLPINKGMKEDLFTAYQRSQESRDLFTKAGVTGISNLWDLFNVLTYQTSHMPDVYLSQVMTQRVVNWARSLQIART